MLPIKLAAEVDMPRSSLELYKGGQQDAMMRFLPLEWQMMLESDAIRVGHELM